MMKLDALKFAFQFSNFGAVGVHLFTGVVPVLINLVDDQGRVTKNHEALYTELNGDSKAMEACFVFSGIVGGQKVDLKYIAKLVLGE